MWHFRYFSLSKKGTILLLLCFFLQIHMQKRHHSNIRKQMFSVGLLFPQFPKYVVPKPHNVGNPCMQPILQSENKMWYFRYFSLCKKGNLLALPFLCEDRSGIIIPLGAKCGTPLSVLPQGDFWELLPSFSLLQKYCASQSVQQCVWFSSRQGST